MVGDVVALALAFAAAQLARRPPTERHTFGFGRTEVLVAEANGVLLLAGAIALIVAAVQRLASPHDVDALGVIVVGGVGLIVNLGSAAVVSRHAHGNLNMRGALWHLLADALGSIAVVISGIGVALFSADWLDPIASILIALLVIAGAWNLLRDATRVLLESVPDDLDPAAVTTALASEAGVDAVHHVHLWTTGSEHAALSAHLVLAGPLSLHDAQLRAGQIKRMLAQRFGIEHATLEVECHTCVDDEAHAHAHPHA
jgi:cobalt-zinc-cadmium efflux system protein